MTEGASVVTGGCIAAIVIIAIVGAMTYGCQRANERYYQAQHDCVASGGTFIPTPGDNNAACIRSGQFTGGAK